MMQMMDFDAILIVESSSSLASAKLVFAGGTKTKGVSGILRCASSASLNSGIQG